MNDYKAATANDMHFLLRETNDNRNIFSKKTMSVNNLNLLEELTIKISI